MKPSGIFKKKEMKPWGVRWLIDAVLQTCIPILVQFAVVWELRRKSTEPDCKHGSRVGVLSMTWIARTKLNRRLGSGLSELY